MELKELLDVAAGRKKASLILRGGKVVDVYSGEILQADVVIHGDRIAALGEGYEAEEVVDVSGKFVMPGFIEGHIHIESSMLSPRRFAEAVSRLGTTTVVADPHEIANVLGVEGIKFMIEDSENLPVDIFFMAPSCVPATNMETSGAVISVDELRALKDEPRILGLAEMMNFPGVILGLPDVIEKLKIFDLKDGHAPLLGGKELNAYIAAGIYSDHECESREEAVEKLRRGVQVMIREGTAARNLDALIGLVNDHNWAFFSLVSDDRHPGTILKEGHMNHLIARAVANGVSLVNSVRMATINTARYFRLHDRGGIAPGKLADIVVSDELPGIVHVIKNGRFVVKDGVEVQKITVPEGRVVGEVRVEPDIGKLKVPAQSGKLRVIVAHEGSLITDAMIVDPEVRDGVVVSDLERDILKISVWERHKGTGNVGVGFVHGFGLKRGAIAGSVAHDSHNIISVGVSDEDIVAAVKHIAEMGGGFVVVADGNVIAELPLPIAGLMSDLSIHEVASKEEELKRAAVELGSKMENAFMTLSFMALPVIPHLKLTDKGLVDVDKFDFVSLFE